MRILIVRHGDPNYEKDCLTEKGKKEATLLAEKLKKEKIDYIYTSPLGRAKETCQTYARAVDREKEIVVKDWLQEFGHDVTFPSGRTHHIPWDMLPGDWIDNPKMYDKDTWYQQDFYEKGGMDIVSCPTCGRTKINLISLLSEFERRAAEEGLVNKKIKVALMGCAVNGPGEAREADIGIAGGNGEGLLFKKGQIIRKIKEEDLINELIEEIKKL